jgi:hypothetical protein
VAADSVVVEAPLELSSPPESSNGDTICSNKRVDVAVFVEGTCRRCRCCGENADTDDTYTTVKDTTKRRTTLWFRVALTVIIIVIPNLVLQVFFLILVIL